MKTVAIIQARMGSTRLPGKVLLDLAGQPVLAWVLARLKRARRLDAIWVATSDRPADAAVAELCARLQTPVFRGSENDVLDRFYQTARAAQADIVLRFTADCPFLDPEVVDWVIEQFLAAQPLDYGWNEFHPRGLDTEVLHFQALARAWHDDTNPAWREHVTAYLYKNPDKFRTSVFRCEQDFSAERWTLDTDADFQFIQTVCRHFGHDHFTWRDVLAALAQHPEWRELNRHIQQKLV